MAAYAALLSLMQIIDDLDRHPLPPISLHKIQVRLLTAKLTFLQQFLEAYNPHLGYTAEADPLEMRIAAAAHMAQDIIETHIVDRITQKEGADEVEDEEVNASDVLYRSLEKVILDLSFIQKQAMEIQGKLPHTPSSSYSSSSSSIVQRCRMVGADDLLLQMKDKLTSHCLDLQILTIVGMGGTGKTTLAMNIYHDRFVKDRFDICAWVVISQEFGIRDILQHVFQQVNMGVVQGLSEHELGEKLYKHLYGRRYLIVMDDMWSIDAWDGVRRFLPDNRNGSRIVITTRLLNLASVLSSDSNQLKMELLDVDESWELLSKCVFGDQDCPVELVETGKKIGNNCKGLRLSIVVVGGLLAKSERTLEFWKYMESNLSRIVNSEDDERCLRILHMSYKHLPVYLKPCFLYMGVYDEDAKIDIRRLTMLWIAEGFLKPIIGKNLEEVAGMYLKDLIDRNLVLFFKDEIGENIRACKMHDLVRNLCLREAEKERFYTVVSGQSKSTCQGIVSGQRRIVISSTRPNNVAIDVASSASLVRSLIWRHHDRELPVLLGHSRLLKILGFNRYFSNGDAQLERSLHQLVNSRFLDITSLSSKFEFPCSSWPFLQTLFVEKRMLNSTPINIWCMPQIRHVEITSFYLRDPPTDQDDVVLGDLQTLGIVMNFSLSEQVVGRIPNLKELIIGYDERVDDERYGLTNLVYLHKLESLNCTFFRETTNASLHSRINLPHTLKELCLSINPSEWWEEILDKIGVLPLLHKLTLCSGSFREGHWETSEGHFISLKYLAVIVCEGLQVWETESTHFPCLEHLLLFQVEKFEEIPLDFAEMSTLKEIDIFDCRDSVAVSGKRIVEEQEELQGETSLQVVVRIREEKEALQSLASPNFRVECRPNYR